MARVAVVTGGTRGIGEAISVGLKEAGYNVAAVYAGNDEKAKEFSERTGIAVFKWDVSNFDACKEGLAKVAAELGPVEIVVNNAGITRDGVLHRMTFEQWNDVIQTNLTSPLILTRFVLRRMLAKGLKGRIVNITSICAQRGYPGLVAYSATKGGMDAATRSLARELGGRILANAIAPGFFASEMSAVLGQTQLDQIIRRTPTGHLTEPEDVLPLVRMLLLDNTNINGQVLVVDGAASI